MVWIASRKEKKYIEAHCEVNVPVINKWVYVHVYTDFSQYGVDIMSLWYDTVYSKLSYVLFRH